MEYWVRSIWFFSLGGIIGAIIAGATITSMTLIGSVVVFLGASIVMAALILRNRV